MKPVPWIAVRRKGLGGAVALIGFLLSPLSWWNDLVVNVPLALAFAWIIGLVYPAAFTGSFILGYWLTNVLGFVLMHVGAGTIIAKGPITYGRRQIGKDLLIALLYTALIVVLVELNVLGPLPARLLHR